MARSSKDPSQYKPEPYLDNTKAPVQLLGLAPLLAPFGDHVSAQRGMMFSNHLPQAQCVYGAEMPKIMTGYETILGDYEFNTTERDQGIQIIETIPRFVVNSGLYPIRMNPSYTIIYRRENDKKIGYFPLEKYTYRSDGYGYQNTWLNTQFLNKGNYIPKEMKLCTSPIHKGHAYGLGTNLRCAYMSIPQVTEDAVVISETAARKLGTLGMGKISFKILPNQLPLNLYGDDEEYRFMPDVGERVHDDGILCALRTPTSDSIISDMLPESLHQIQHMHDTVFYVPIDSEIVDVNIYINRKCKIKTPKEIFTQAEKYRAALNEYYLRIWETYQKVSQEGFELTPEFNTLVTTALSNLLADGVRIPNYIKKADVTLVKKKEPIDFIYVTVTYAYHKPIGLGSKLTGRYGNKGVVSKIAADEDMPVDDYGIRADMIMNPVAVFNRMNTAQFLDQDVNRADYFVLQAIKDMPPLAAFEYISGYLSFINPKWGALCEKLHSTEQLKVQFIQEVKEKGLYKQVSPFQEGFDETFSLRLQERYPHPKTPVTFAVYDREGNRKVIRTKRAVSIGDEYIYLLYKTPHLSSAGTAYVNQFHTPIRPSSYGRLQYPFSQTPIKVGEDEGRNITMVAGAPTMARILGMYANSPKAVNQLEHVLISSKQPSQLKNIGMTTEEIVESNTIIGVARHIFATAGIDIAPKQTDTNVVMDLPEIEEKDD